MRWNSCIRCRKGGDRHMPREYDEKRDYIRITVDCEIRFCMSGSGQKEIGKVTNLSGRGMMFIADRELAVDERAEVHIEPENTITPPLHANVRIVRVNKQRHGDGYEIGAVIQEILD